ncbi:MAG: 16S rRNA (adenine(1518)-N(6)/adenine(1519)-N(6))-dimethyltransferase RsmA [Planctomycetota bacterium]|jgi:16S rRNA (adenine1518-N6/adenine1519-N6)-dimethyltransferase|nr:16S rRNA (adenine(1518)-N(6)/adenine(1519)-N(6))-dimethyltransferase RsmA [Planctomycetota bacterium]HJO17661.1 16S rRNA (adenine(1518)-N(6)/adenine(1519)-N(6))-dimethyltransferase RsmA [Vicinamibacterales bacterium]|tara:strand:- start:807 stop:1676 length:870 start_codon:yes stop_codon:yes gene_type:complete
MNKEQQAHRKRGASTNSSAPIRKRFGQHFLEDTWTPKLIAAIAPKSSDCFVEVGPGRGVLTYSLAARSTHVVAIEIDRDLANNIRRQQNPQITIVEGDVLETDLKQLTLRTREKYSQSPIRLVGNLPFNISSPLLFKVFSIQRSNQLFEDATLLLQSEVADRLIAKPGSKAYGPLAVMAAVHAQISRRLVLPPGAFRPPPKVRSAVVRLRFRSTKLEIPNFELFEKLVRQVFQHRRKMLSNALLPIVRECRAEISGILSKTNIDGTRRPEGLQLAEFAMIASELNKFVD